MTNEPVSIFARIVDPAGVARRLREVAPSVEIDGPDGAWNNAVVRVKKWWKTRSITFTHNPEYYSEPNWSKQMDGMSGYFSRFPDTEQKWKALSLPTTFKFSIGTLVDPDFTEDDPRLAILFEVASVVDGVLFTPSALRDSHGRVLFGAGGEDDEDPTAVWPKVIAEVQIKPRGESPGEVASPSVAAEDDDPPIDPPRAERVARRALALTAIAARGLLEHNTNEPDRMTTFQEMHQWIRDVGIGDELEPNEWEVLQRPLGKLDSQSTINSVWRLEALTVLAWALQLMELPPHDRLAVPADMWRRLGWLDADAAKTILREPKLRTRDAIETLRKRLFAIHWRLRNYHLRPQVMDFAEFARTSWFGPLDIAGLSLVGGDLALGGQRIDKASSNDFSAAHSTARERHQAVIWLASGPAKFSDAEAHT